MSRGPVAQLAAELRALRNAMGKPTYRELARRAGYSPAVLSQAAAGRTLPSWPVVQAYVNACGGDPEHWEKRWRDAGDAQWAPAELGPESGAEKSVEHSTGTYGHSEVLLQLTNLGPAEKETQARPSEKSRAGCIAVFLVDDHEIVRRGIAEFIEDEPDLTVVGEAESVAEAMARLPNSDAHVAVLDVRLPDGNGVDLCRELRSQLPGLNCLMLTSYADDEALFDAIMAGASGFVHKQVMGNDLLNAIRTVGQGGSLLDPRTTAALLDRLRRRREESDPLATLSDQERAVLDLVADGLTNRQISERLFLSEKTVKNYVSHLLAKLGMERRTQVAVLAAEIRSREGRTALPPPT